ncbi:uncharacterized protein [Nicotiana tomentosiformis]|uniref:uncharacterized protein isoform X1 n=1 Tax=Nicotiana tomentosiformis TaxID=4098 RepID=UPI00051C9E17|nr:uncharacterized protein LOC104087088 isoform X1 [Nicotiana tomentosiformis]
MVIKKRVNKLPAENGGTNDVEGFPKNKKCNEQFDHWAFLDQIEAPMWVDLTLEYKSAYQEKDDDWFHISHPFHHASSKMLKSAFSHAGEGSINLELGLQGSCSPKLPPSISRSRGKDFRNRQLGQGYHWLTLDKKHPVKQLSSKSSSADSEACKVVKQKASSKKLTNYAASDSGSSCQPPDLSSGNEKISSNSLAVMRYESLPRSCITSENGEQHYQKSLGVNSLKKPLKVSDQVLGRTSGFLSDLRVSLGKSCVTRQASRMEANNFRQSEGQKSSSSMSSVGSSSNPYKERENLNERKIKEKTPDSRNASRMARAPIGEIKKAKMSKVPVQPPDKTSNAKLVTGRSVSSSIRNEGAKEKVHQHNVQRKPLIFRRANDHVSSIVVSKATARIGGSQCVRTVGTSKVNVVGRMGMTQKSSINGNQRCRTEFTSYTKENKRSTENAKSSDLMVNADNKRDVANRVNTKKKVFLR